MWKLQLLKLTVSAFIVFLSGHIITLVQCLNFHKCMKKLFDVSKCYRVTATLLETGYVITIGGNVV